MNRTIRSLSFLVFLVFVGLPFAHAVENVNCSGVWSSDLVGDVTLKQSGDRVTGSYRYTNDDGIAKEGRIEGTILGNTITAKWWESPSGGGRPQGRIGEETQGDLEWQLTENGRMLSGWYREEGHRDNGEEERQEWNLER